MTKKSLINISVLYFMIVLSPSLFSQIQVGNDIDGFAEGEQSGYSVNMPNSNHVIIGSPYDNDGRGMIRVMEWNGDNWIQKGATESGSALGDFFGWSVSMPDENTIAASAYMSDSNGPDAGHVRVYEFEGLDWIQKGGDIIGESSSDLFGSSISMPDPNTIAIGATGNDENASLSGHVQVYIWNGVNWIQKGFDIDGENLFDQSGNSVSMPDSDTVVIGARYNDDNGISSGNVRIFEWDGLNWVQKGSNIVGEAAGDNFGVSVSMPDADTFAAGAYQNNDNGTGAGHVRIFTWDGNAWLQKGLDIDGEEAGDLSGYSVSMPNANTVAIGARYNSDSGTYAGHTRIYSWNGSNWIQFGNDIDGEAEGDNSGASVSMSDENTVAIGAFGNDGSGMNAGHVRVYSLCSNTISMISPTACDSFISPSGNFVWSSSGFYLDTIPNTAGCDSIIGIDLTINSVDVSLTINSPLLSSNASGAEYQWIDCDNNFTAIAGENEQDFTATENGNYAVIVTQNGCVDTSSCYEVNSISVDEKQFRKEILIYPNPSKADISIDLGNQFKYVRIVLSDLYGKVIQSKEYDNKQLIKLELGNSPGIYLLWIQSDNFTTRRKLIKQ